MTPAPALDLTTSLRGDFSSAPSAHGRLGQLNPPPPLGNCALERGGLSMGLEGGGGGMVVVMASVKAMVKVMTSI